MNELLTVGHFLIFIGCFTVGFIGGGWAFGKWIRWRGK